MHCFRRAESKLEYNVCDGYDRIQKANRLSVENPKRRAIFLEAAKIFKQCAEETSTPQIKRAYYKTLGKCLAEAGKYRKASDAYYLAMEYTLAAQHARKAGDFDRALQIIDNHFVDSKVASLIRQVSGVQYMRDNAFE
jgi:tetratricopeptide (TPR) repeat protein